MKSWRESILNDFVPNVSRLTLVADPDSLLTEETLALELRRRGFELIEFNDPVEFRYAYESKYRAIWDRGEHTDLVVILRLQDTELESLPYDLLQAGRKLSFNLGNLFPNLSYPVLEQLDRSFLDALFEAQHTFSPDRMGDNATRDFILRHVFRVAAELIVTDVDLLRVLLRLHYSKIALPEILALRLVQQLRGQAGFHEWPLDVIVSDEEAFFAFLQEQRPQNVPGSVVVPSLEGTRPILVEIQALVSSSNLGMPRRTAIGVDHNRVSLLVAVLDKICGMHLGSSDIFINVAGGVRVEEPAVDLGVVAAMASSFLDRPVDSRTVILGEVGLTGEVRAVSQIEVRVKEAARLGFSRCLVPKTNAKQLTKIVKMEVCAISSLKELLENLF